jgi:putative addiction module component (TIGR02574 family)
MASMTREEVLRGGMTLPPAERLRVARELALSAQNEGEDLPEAEWNAAWGEEAERRHREVDEGKVRMIPGEEVMARARAIVRS